MFNKKFIKLCVSLVSIFYVHTIYADINISKEFPPSFYLGVTGGWGSTTWGQLVPKNSNAALSISTPTNVSESGLVWGVVGGYEFIPQFAIEANYMRFPTARLYFDETSLFNFHYDRTELSSNSEAVSITAKIMLIIPRTAVRVFSSFGPAAVHRSDAIKDIWHISPAFSAGLNCNLTPHWIAELGTNYVAGYGKPELDPTTNYIPFLYSAFVRLAYRF